MKIIIFFLVIFTLLNICYAQTFLIGLGGGFVKILNPNNLVDDASEGGLGLDSGYLLGGKAKYVFPNKSLRIILGIDYLSLRENEKYWGVEKPEDSRFSDIDVKNSLKILSLAGGLEYKISSNQNSEYFNIEVSINNFNNLSQSNTYNEIWNFGYTPPKGIRFGGGAGVGYQFLVFQKMNIDINATFKYMNLIGKESSQEKSFTQMNFTLSLLYTI